MRAICLALLAVLSATGAAAQDAAVRAAVDRAEEARREKAFPAAAAEYAAADRAATKKEDGEYVEAKLKDWATAAPKDSADQLYACNALGQFYAGRNRFGEAVAAYERVLKPDGPDAYVYVANHARALQRNGQVRPALDKYRASLALEPRYSLAADRAVSLLTTARELTPADRLTEADKLLHTPGLPTAVARSATFDVLAALPEEWAAVGPAAAAAGALRKLQDSTVVGTWVNELWAVYDGTPFAPDAELFHPGARARFADWVTTPGGGTDMARLLVRGGSGFRARSLMAERPVGQRTEDARQAVFRYAAAYELDRTATAALAKAVAVATAYGDRLDPGGKQFVALTRELYGPKSPLRPAAVLTAADHHDRELLEAVLAAGRERCGISSGPGHSLHHPEFLPRRTFGPEKTGGRMSQP